MKSVIRSLEEQMYPLHEMFPFSAIIPELGI